ncbi:MAG: Hsp33 family molecular chaperone HslO [Oscillospiraceae bacterium]|nr:Hsp33 family molecular chaperone HslO [Oscillospiraceae bacterium]MDD3833411.1 Hsp33 family molecular chaperone HslO [Oscillospiraceae bacterium]
MTPSEWYLLPKEELKDRLKNLNLNTNKTGRVIRCITKDASLMAMVMDSTAIVAEAERIHKTSAVITAGLGRLLTAASMMGIMLKGKQDSLTIKISGGGPAGTVMAVSDSEGNARGYAANPVVEIPLRPDGKLDVGGAVGKSGLLHVMRDTGGSQPYIGCTHLVSGEIAEDITNYYANSEQTPTVCALGVLVNPDLTVRVAGGILLQLLPFCPDDVIDRVEKNIASLDSMTSMLDGGLSLAEICERALTGFEFEVLDEYSPVYRCGCSRDRIARAFATMTTEELMQLPDEKGITEVTCHFCDAVYHFMREELLALHNNATSGK